MNRSAMYLRSLFAVLLSLALSHSASASTEPAGPMANARQTFAAVPLADGRALVIGGWGIPGRLGSTEIYDPVGTTFTSTGSLLETRAAPAAALLQDGRVLVLGGSTTGVGSPPLASAEIFDPATGTWSAAASMSVARDRPVALALADGRVLVMGGSQGTLPCEIYDAATGTFSTTGSLNFGRDQFVASLLQDGRVLVAGGSAQSAGVSTAEVWDPVTGLWSPVGSMLQPRVDPTATVLQDGTVLVAGGQTGISNTLFVAEAEIFDPATGTFTVTGSLNQARGEHVAARLPDGRVVIAGGTAASQYASDSVEIYDPALGTWSVLGALTDARRRHSGVLLADGSLLVAGGYNAVSNLASAEIIDPACMASAAAISPSGASFTSVAASGTVSVAHVSGCTWRVTSASSWLTITGAAQGSGSGTVSYSVADNTGATRTAALNIANNTFTVNQAANPCVTSTLNPAAGQYFASAGGPSTVDLSIGVGCAWSVTGASSWISITSGGSGPGAISFTVAQNLGVARNATFTIAGASFFVSQSASPCVPSPTITPASRNFAGTGGSWTISVTAPAACSWTVSAVPPWITIASSGTGNATISFTVASNTTPAPRSANVNVAGSTFVVTQDGNACGGATLNPSSVSLPNTATIGTVTLGAPSGCAWVISGAPSWISFSSSSGTGSTTLTYQVGSNNGPPQSATMFIAGVKLVMSQAQSSCYPYSTISPTGGPTFAYGGGTFTVNVTAQPACSWTAWNLPAWITITSPLPKTGSATVTYSVAANSGVSRSASIVIAGVSHFVPQAAGPCSSATISPTSSPMVPGTGTSLQVYVTAQPGCTWTVTGLPSWITVTSPLPVSGSGNVTYAVAANSGAPRNASIVIAGVTHSVSQSAGACYGSTISPASTSTLPASGINFVVNVTTQSNCTWTVSGLPAWITMLSPLPVTGSAGAAYSVAANGGAARSASIVIAGVTHTVSQAASSCVGATISPTSFTMGPAATTATVYVTTQPGCLWTVAGLPAWIAVTSPVPVGGSGIVTYSVASNSGPARGATLVIAGVNHAVSQSGVAPPPPAYCASNASSTGYEWIAEIAVAGAVRTSGNNGGYGDFTASAPIALVRGSNAASVVPGFSSGAYSEGWAIWIDFNHDNVFSDSEIVFTGTSSGTMPGSIVVPAGALSGPTRMRVSMQYGGAPAACGTFTWGEVEDYTVTIP